MVAKRPWFFFQKTVQKGHEKAYNNSSEILKSRFLISKFLSRHFHAIVDIYIFLQ